MRNLLLLILFVNVLAFIYQRWVIEPETPVAADYLDQQVPELAHVQRAEEPEQEPVATEAADDGVVVATGPERGCLRVGPFAKESDAESVRADLTEQGAEVQQSAEVGDVWVGYWVQTTVFGSRDAADQARRTLVEDGLLDAYVLPGEQGFRISLGVFRLRSSADGVISQASALDIETRLIERYQPGTNFWLTVRMPGDRAVQPGDIRSASGQILRTESILCDPA